MPVKKVMKKTKMSIHYHDSLKFIKNVNKLSHSNSVI